MDREVWSPEVWRRPLSSLMAHFTVPARRYCAKLIFISHSDVCFLQPLIATMMSILVTMTMADNNRDGDLDGVGHGLLDVNGHVLLNMDGVRPVDGHLHGEWHGLLHRVGDVFLNGVGSGHGHFDGVGHGLLNVNGVRTVDGNLHGVGDGLLHRVGDGLLYWVRHGLGDMYGVRPVNVHLDGHMHFLVHGVRLRHMNRNLHGVGDLLLYWVRSGHWDLDGHMHLFLDGVGLGNVYLDGVRPVDVHMDGVGYLLLDRVGLRDVHGYLNDFLDGVRHVLNDGVGLGNMHLDGVRDLLLYGVGDVLLYWVGNRDVLYDRDGLVGVGVSVGIEATAVAATVATLESTVPIAQSDVPESTFLVLLFLGGRLLVVGHCHFFFCFLGFFGISEGQDSHQTGGHELRKAKKAINIQIRKKRMIVR